jgi:Tol biopolymer transport system component/serine/threonine protein kinase
MSLERGSLLNNRYRVLEILGQGGMGAIYRAVDENLGVNVAVKENMFTTEEYARQFRREALILANLRHPNLPRVTDHFVIDSVGQYLVMDFISGEDLRDRMDREGLLPDAEVVLLGTAICEALGYLHSRQPQIVHRDIKPGNVKITPTGQVVLVDFGLAKTIQEGENTTTGARAMTPGYSPPEQYGMARTDCRSDVYSLGATLYVALSGSLPEDALARAMGQAELTPVRKHNPKASKRLAAVIEHALELRPEDRYQSSEEFKQALLNSRVITGRRPQEITLTPPPFIPSLGEGEGSGEVVNPGGNGGGVPRSVEPPPADSWPAFNTALSAPVFRPVTRPRRKRSLGCWTVLLIVAGLAAVLAAGVYTTQPDLLGRAFSQASPYLAGIVLPDFLRSPTPTGTPPVTSTATLTPTSNIFVALGATQAVTPTQQVATPTFTPSPTLSPTPAPTLMGGGGGLIAFASDRGSKEGGRSQIWLMNSDGTAQRKITDMPGGACQPAWSPDGNRLAFISPCKFNYETYDKASIFIINADGTGEAQQLPTAPGGDFDPAWSPDGREIMFTSLRGFGPAQIYAINLADNSVRSIGDKLVWNAQASWSPDGSQIVFITTRRNLYQIWTMDRDGQNAALLSRSKDLIDGHPVWSPDGQVILFTQTGPQGGVPRLVAIPSVIEDYSNYLEFYLYDDLRPRREAVFSPDGMWFAYEAWPGGDNHDIYVDTLNGLGFQQLTTDAAFDFDPAWQPAPGQP